MDIQTLCAQAASIHQRGNLAEAEQLYLRVLQSDPNHFAAQHMLGILRSQQGRNREALELIARALKENPRSAGAWTNYGLVLGAEGRLDEALASYDKALALEPGFTGALFNRGNTLRELRRFEEALACYNVGLETEPKNSDALNNLGLTFWDLKRFEEALASYDRALVSRPDFALALNNRGNALRKLRRFEQALESYDKALAIKPDHFKALHNRGITLWDLKRFEEALASYERALQINPVYVEAWCSRGFALLDMKRFESALTSLEKALDINPQNAEAWYNRGIALCNLGRANDALASYDKALAIDPDRAEAWSGRAVVLRDLRRFEEALRGFDKVLAIEPQDAVAWNNRGCILRDLGRPDEALASFDKAISIKPDYAEALFNRGIMQGYGSHRHEAAIADFERVILINPDYDYARGDLFHMRMQVGDWRDFDRQSAALNAGIRDGKRVARPFVYQAVSDSPALLQACASIFSKNFHPSPTALWKRSDHRNPKIRIGYMSGEFREQATAYLTTGLFECHDKSRFEIVAFDNGRGDNSPIRTRLETAFDAFVNISALSDLDAAMEIAAQRIDILVDLNGYFGTPRPGVFARRPAPIQVNYLGFPGTSGAQCMDYILADRIVIPEGERRYYTENVVYLPDSYQVNDSRRHISEVGPNRAECGLPETAFVFCNFNQSYKLTPEIFALWMRILKHADGSVLWLLENNELFPQNMRSAAAQHGVAAERLVFAPTIPLDKHLARLKLADLCLDTLPYNAHTTASDALWVGLPVVTCKGDSFAGRVAASLLQAIGLPELVTDNLAGYEALVIKLARQPGLLQAFRQRLFDNRLTTSLFDTDRFRKNIEAAYVRMWQIAERGERPQSFSVEEQTESR